MENQSQAHNNILASGPLSHVKEPDLKRVVGIVLLALSLGSFIIGYIYLYGTCFTLTQLAKDFYSNVSSSLASIAITILIIDYLSERRADREQLRRLAREMGSKDNAFAVKATKEMRARGWLTDGSLHGIDLDAADLSNADISGANLSCASCVAASMKNTFAEGSNFMNAKITGAHLEDAKLANVDFSGADLRWSYLNGAILTGAKLDEADFEGAILTGAEVTMIQLRRAKSLRDAIMPDGTKYENGRTNN